MEYKEYIAKIQYSTEDNVFFGVIEGIADLVTFEGTSIEELEKEFKDAVDDYLNMCNEVGKNPDKPYKGQFNVRIDPQLHREVVFKAARENITLNQAVGNALREYVSESKSVNTTTTAIIPIGTLGTFFPNASKLNKSEWKDGCEKINTFMEDKNG